VGAPAHAFQILDIIAGLRYLHELELAHGDLKGVRVRLAPGCVR
jgi:hypothetical protein